MGNAVASSLAVFCTAVAAVLVWVAVRLVNRPYDNSRGDFVRWLLYNAARSMKGARDGQVAREGQMLYSSGLALMGVGLVLMFGTFATLIAGFSTIGSFEGNALVEVFRAFGGLLLVMIGRFLLHVAVNGWTGFGIIRYSAWAMKNGRRQMATSANKDQLAAWDLDAVRRIENELQASEQSNPD